MFKVAVTLSTFSKTGYFQTTVIYDYKLLYHKNPQHIIKMLTERNNVMASKKPNPRKNKAHFLDSFLIVASSFWYTYKTK